MLFFNGAQLFRQGMACRRAMLFVAVGRRGMQSLQHELGPHASGHARALRLCVVRQQRGSRIVCGRPQEQRLLSKQEE